MDPVSTSVKKMPLIEHVSDADLERVALERVVPSLLTHGFCSVDGLLGELTGGIVLEQVKEMHRSGMLQDGRLAGSVPGVHRRSIRGDKIAWVSGSERGCEAISFLLDLIDRLVSVCASRLGTKAIRERSKVRPTTGECMWNHDKYNESEAKILITHGFTHEKAQQSLNHCTKMKHNLKLIKSSYALWSVIFI